jgi:hypothetical protein
MEMFDSVVDFSIFNTWPSTGGVARYDTQLSIIFPKRIFFKGPQDKDKLLSFLKTCKNPIVITDNHLACDIPNDYPIILVHHGSAQTTANRNPDWEKYWRDLCCNGQNKMLSHRSPKNTWIVSISTACTEDFTKYYPDTYPKFKRIDIMHPSEFDESIYKTKFTNKKPVILGNWNHLKKGKHLFPKLKEKLPEFEFLQLQITPNVNESLESFNKRKQQIYLNSDIFLQIANSEGFSYASNDTMVCGLVPVCTNVGQFYADVPADSFIKLDWNKCYGKDIDYDYIANSIRKGWANKDKLADNARQWYLKHCKFKDWELTMKKVINDFYIHNYSS